MYKIMYQATTESSKQCTSIGHVADIAGLSYTSAAWRRLIESFNENQTGRSTSADMLLTDCMVRSRRRRRLARSTTVWVKKFLEVFWHFFPNGWEFSVQIFPGLLRVPIYARRQIFIQLSATLMKLWHITRDYPAVHVICSKCPPSTETHAGWSHLIWHNFVTVGENWMKICNLA